MKKLNRLAEESYNISKKRQQNGANINADQILKHIGTELVEAVEAKETWKSYQRWMNILYNPKANEDLYSEEKENEFKKEYEEELADVIICCLIEAYANNIDIDKAVKNKIEKNRLRAEKQGDKL